MKKIITVFLSLMASVALWAHDLEVDSIYYNLFGEDNVEVTYFGRWPGGSYSGAVVIPETVEYNGITYHVTRIGVSAFAECSSLTSISIPESITHIGSRAFWGCSSLEYVYIPKSVTKIESAAFANCSSLYAIDVPKTNEVYNSHDNCKAIVETATNTLIAGCKNSRINISVEHIAEYAFYGCTGLTEISIPMSVETIGREAFSGCTSLKSIKIPNTTYNIEEQAFYGCSSLSLVELPYNLKSIKRFSFAGCSSLTNFDIPDKVTVIEESAFQNCSSLKKINLHDGITQIGNQVFSGCTSLSSITIPNGITMIGDGTFANCSSLTYIRIPNTVEWIGWSVFGGCSSLKSIDLSDKLQSISYGTFRGCSTLTSITIPNSVTSIGEGAFSDCSALESIQISENVTNIEKQAFLNCASLKSIHIPDKVTGIGEQAFWECSSLTSVTIGKGLKYVQENVFVGCPIASVVWNAKHFDDPYWGSRMAPFQGNNTMTSFVLGDSVEHIPAYLCFGIMSLSSITIPKDVTSIGDCTFGRCPSLSSITVHEGNRIFDSRNQCNAIIETASNTLVAGCKTTIIPDGTDSIGKYAFYDCDELTSISIPKSVKSIGFEAFRSCSTLDTIYCNATTPPSLEEITFTDDSGIIRATVTLYVPCESLEAYKTHEVWGRFSNIQCIEEDEEKEKTKSYIYYTSSDGNIVTPNAYPSATEVFGANIISNTYENGQGIITFDGAVTSIGDNAFLNCSSLTSITIPNSITSIGVHAFDDCESLISINIPNSITSIGEMAFAWCSSLTSIEIPNSLISIENGTFVNCSSLTSITIPNSVTNIGESAFRYCSSLTSITIPENVTSIGKQAFAESSSLDTIYCYIKTPLEITADIFSQYNATLYVPCESLEAYKAHEVWSLFTNIQCIEDVETSIENTQSQSPMTDCQKIIRDGQLFILHNGKSYTIMGQEL